MKKILFISLIVLQNILYASSPIFTITIQRNMTCSDNSTMGRLLVNNQEIGRTLELPWRNNQSNISRIPKGIYSAFIRNDGKRKWRIELKDVKDRKHVQIHIGNYQSQIQGCILVGKSITKHNKECMVTDSRNTLKKLKNEINKARQGHFISQDIDIKVIIK